MANEGRNELLISTRRLEDRLDDPDLRVYDTTVHLTPKVSGFTTRSGRPDYEKKHIPGAGFLDLLADLADPSSRLQFPRPPLARLEEVLSGAGVAHHHRVVVYSASEAMWATRLWWLLRAAGLNRVSVLDGGLVRWEAEGRPVSTAPCTYPLTTFKARARNGLWATKEEVLEAVDSHSVCTLNALPRSFSSGGRDLGYPRPGQIKGSVNAPFSTLLDPQTGLYRSDQELRGHFQKVGALQRERVITYCGGAIAATLNAFALKLLGHPNVAVYDGSLDEWARDETLPMETHTKLPL